MQMPPFSYPDRAGKAATKGNILFIGGVPKSCKSLGKAIRPHIGGTLRETFHESVFP